MTGSKLYSPVGKHTLDVWDSIYDELLEETPSALFSPILFEGTIHLWGQVPLTDGPLTLEQS
jgi:hypothetical protein